MSAAEEIRQEMQPNVVADRLAGVEGMLKNEKVKLPDDVLESAINGIKNIREKLERRFPVYESDFDFVEELREAIKIVRQYDGAMQNLKGGDLYNPEKPIEGDKKAPTQEEVISTLQAKLTKEQKEVIAQMKNPVLLVKPITTWRRFEENLNSVRQIDTNTIRPEWTKSEKYARITNKITGWEVGFAEGEQELDGKEKEGALVGDLITEWQNGSLAKKGAKLVTNNEYMLLIANSIKKEKPIDKKNWSILREEGRENIIGSDGAVSYGGLYWSALDFRGIVLNGFSIDMRFRYAVMVKI